jgi:hypothetical protein
MKYNQEEKEILQAYESGQLKLSKPSKEEIAAIKAAALNTFKKDKRITIRLYETHHCNFSPRRSQSDAEIFKIRFLSVLSELCGEFLKFLFRSAWPFFWPEAALV